MAWLDFTSDWDYFLYQGMLVLAIIVALLLYFLQTAPVANSNLASVQLSYDNENGILWTKTVLAYTSESPISLFRRYLNLTMDNYGIQCVEKLCNFISGMPGRTKIWHLYSNDQRVDNPTEYNIKNNDQLSLRYSLAPN